MSDLVERLEVWSRSEFANSQPGYLLADAAEHITRLRAELAEARDKALDEAASELEAKILRWEAAAKAQGKRVGKLHAGYTHAAQAIRALKSL